LAVGILPHTHPGRLLAARAHQHHVLNVKWGLNLNNAGLASPAALDVLLDDVDAFDHHTVTLGQVLAHNALLTLVATTGDQHLIASTNLPHRSSLQRFRRQRNDAHELSFA